jgi:hypothetical protein
MAAHGSGDARLGGSSSAAALAAAGERSRRVWLGTCIVITGFDESRGEDSMTWSRSSIMALAMLAAGCAFNPPPVPVDARPADLERLTGRWAGRYERVNSGRAGSIEFNLVYGEDHAHGDVVMIPGGSPHAYRSWREDGVARGPVDAVQELTIRFVAVDDGEITGELDAYRDPDCDCRAYTRFRGRLRGDVVEGTFVTHTTRAAGPVQGTWKVTRKRR